MRRLAPLAALTLLLQGLTACGGAPPPAAPSPSDTGTPPAQGTESDGDLVGQPLAGPLPTRWIGAPLTLDGGGDDAGVHATLIRFWTDTCPFCTASLPAVQALRDTYGPRGLQTVGVYHPKPPRAVDDATVRDAAEERGYTGPLAVDPDWTTVRELWLDAGDGAPRATSASLLVDRDGIIRHVHPGPEFHPSDDPAHASCDADYRALERAIEELLGDG